MTSISPRREKIKWSPDEVSIIHAIVQANMKGDSADLTSTALHFLQHASKTNRHVRPYIVYSIVYNKVERIKRELERDIRQKEKDQANRNRIVRPAKKTSSASKKSTISKRPSNIDDEDINAETDSDVDETFSAKPTSVMNDEPPYKEILTRRLSNARRLYNASYPPEEPHEVEDGSRAIPSPHAPFDIQAVSELPAMSVTGEVEASGLNVMSVPPLGNTEQLSHGQLTDIDNCYNVHIAMLKRKFEVEMMQMKEKIKFLENRLDLFVRFVTETGIVRQEEQLRQIQHLRELYQGTAQHENLSLYGVGN